MPRDRRQIEELKAVANARVFELLGKLGIDARPRGQHGTIAVCDPMTKDTEPSLVIWTGRPGGLSWKRYGSDAKGDIINLVAYLKGWWWGPLRGSGEAILWLKDTLGLRRMSDQERAEARRISRIADAQREKRHAEDLARHQNWARGLFFNADHNLLGTLAETYLRERRGIELRKLPRLPRFLRFLPRHKHIGETETFWPCLVAACVDPASGDVRAVHRTWLRHDGRDKAPVAPPRKCFPEFGGLIIPIWKGAGELTIRAAIANGVREELGLTEGWEDGLSWALSCPERRVWAAISLSNFGNVVLPECIDAVLLARQNDWERFAASQEFERQKLRLEAQGRPVVEVAAHHGKDLSDTLRGAA